MRYWFVMILDEVREKHLVIWTNLAGVPSLTDLKPVLTVPEFMEFKSIKSCYANS